MAAGGGRSVAASVVGWIIVALIVYFAFGWIVGTLRFIVRIVVILVVLGALMALYLKLRGAD